MSFSINSGIDIIRNYGLTGNPVLDTMIFTNLIPIIVGYWQTMSVVFKNLLAYLVKYLMNWFNHKFMNQTNNAELVFYSDISSRNTLLYKFLMDNVEFTNTSSDAFDSDFSHGTVTNSAFKNTVSNNYL